jgi:3-dehydroquinate synthetase
MIGAFPQPRAVISDVATLDTLPDRELRAGLAEVIKHGLALDLGFVEWLEGNVDKLLARERSALIYAVRRCCELKARVVAADERETGERALLNFGHTFGHAIEGGMGYGSWLHGEAISAGMVMAAELSFLSGSIGKGDAERVRALLARAGLPVKGPALTPDRMLELMAVDKKAAKGKPRFVLLSSIGKAVLRSDIEDKAVREAIVAAAQ